MKYNEARLALHRERVKNQLIYDDDFVQHRERPIYITKPTKEKPSALRTNVYVIDRQDNIIREHRIDMNSKRRQLWLLSHVLWAILNHHSVEIINVVDDK